MTAVIMHDGEGWNWLQ